MLYSATLARLSVTLEHGVGWIWWLRSLYMGNEITLRLSTLYHHRDREETGKHLDAEVAALLQGVFAKWSRLRCHFNSISKVTSSFYILKVMILSYVVTRFKSFRQIRSVDWKKFGMIRWSLVDDLNRRRLGSFDYIIYMYLSMRFYEKTHFILKGSYSKFSIIYHNVYEIKPEQNLSTRLIIRHFLIPICRRKFSLHIRV